MTYVEFELLYRASTIEHNNFLFNFLLLWFIIISFAQFQCTLLKRCKLTSKFQSYFIVLRIPLYQIDALSFTGIYIPIHNSNTIIITALHVLPTSVMTIIKQSSIDYLRCGTSQKKTGLLACLDIWMTLMELVPGAYWYP